MIVNSIIYFLGGIGLFLFGMKLMSDGLELSTGSRLKRILELLTTNKYMGVLVGIVVTAIIQSSTATTVMIVGFVNAGLINLTQAVGVIIGANIGTTTTGLIIALNLHSIAPICIFVGAMASLFSKNKKVKYISMVIMGFGVLFLGMGIMGDAMKPLSALPEVINFFKYAENPLIGLLIGFVVTALVQSSTASIGILLAAMAGGIITDLNQAIFILYGQNLGTCVTAIVASIGSSKTARKASMIHFVYNFIGITIFTIITLLPFGFTDFIKGLTGNVSQQLIYTHIIINIGMGIMLLPLSNFIIKITEKIIKAKDKPKTDIDFEYIDENLIDKPSFALVQVYKEIERLANLVLKNYKLSQNIVLEKCENIEKSIELLYKNENTINYLSGRINKYLTKLSSKELEYSDVKLVTKLYRVILYIERTGNHVINIVKSYELLNEEKQAFSKEATKELNEMMKNTYEALSKSTKVFEKSKFDNEKILEVKELEKKVDIQNERYKNNHIERINNKMCNPVAGISFIKILTDLERISDYACNIAYSQYQKK
jgi:Na/Pi-cotransporter